MERPSLTMKASFEKQSTVCSATTAMASSATMMEAAPVTMTPSLELRDEVETAYPTTKPFRLQVL